MINISSWMANADPIDFNSEAAAANWTIIQDRPTVITVIRNGQPLPTGFTVRLEPYSIAREEQQGFQTAGLERAIIFGIKGHPDPSVPDTDIRINDEVVSSGLHYSVITVLDSWGEIQAVCEIIA